VLFISYHMVLSPMTLSDLNPGFKITVLYKDKWLKLVHFLLSNCR